MIRLLFDVKIQLGCWFSALEHIVALRSFTQTARLAAGKINSLIQKEGQVYQYVRGLLFYPLVTCHRNRSNWLRHSNVLPFWMGIWEPSSLFCWSWSAGVCLYDMPVEEREKQNVCIGDCQVVAVEGPAVICTVRWLLFFSISTAIWQWGITRALALSADLPSPV